MQACLVLLSGWRPLKERKKNYRAPQRLSIKLRSIQAKYREKTGQDLCPGISGTLTTLSAASINATFLYLPGPGGGMADAEDLKSSGDFSSCGFDSHPGHHFLRFSLNWSGLDVTARSLDFKDLPSDAPFAVFAPKP